MKIAFCFLTQGDLLQSKVWETFFAGAADEKYTIYCHPKEPAQVKSPVLHGRAIADRVPTRHGHVSLVAATLNLFAHAYRDAADNAYFLLVSESTIPIVPFDVLYDGLETSRARSLIAYNVPPPGTEHHRRLFATGQPGLFSSAFFQHDQWVILHRRHVSMLLEKPGLALFGNVFAADEHYFMNALVHLRGAAMDQFVNKRATFVNWRERVIKTYTNRQTGQVVGRTVHPKSYRLLSEADIAEARDSGCWFFRKVEAECDCAAVLRRLETEPAAT